MGVAYNPLGRYDSYVIIFRSAYRVKGSWAPHAAYTLLVLTRHPASFTCVQGTEEAVAVPPGERHGRDAANMEGLATKGR